MLITPSDRKLPASSRVPPLRSYSSNPFVAIHPNTTRDLPRGATQLIPQDTQIMHIPPISTHIYPHTRLILHQPRKSRKYVNFPFYPQNLNGIPVSRPPFFGERPYPRQFHPVGNHPFLTIFDPIFPVTTA